MIDICIYWSPRTPDDNGLGNLITKFRAATPTQTVNHTDFEPICARPLLLSIETKKPGVNLDTAQLQMGSWHAAQWAFLRWAVGEKLRAQCNFNMLDTDEGRQALEAEALSILSTLEFIPGIIIQGHRWLLVLSTYDCGKTIMWTDHQFGTTQSYLEIYAVIAGIRQLTAWARDVYLDWFHKNILN
jgi:hypothetical protein